MVMQDAELNFVRFSHRPDLIQPVARWWFDEWAQGATSINDVESKLSEEVMADPEQLPITLLALRSEQLVGTVPLRDRDRASETHPELKHWIGGVFVSPEARGTGLGAKLVSAVECLARNRDVFVLYLSTLALDGGLYARAGYQPLQQLRSNEEMILLMEKRLDMDEDAFSKAE